MSESATQTKIALSQELRDLAAGIAAAPPARDQRGAIALLLGMHRYSPSIREVLELSEQLRAQINEPDPMPVSVRHELLRAEMAKRGFAGVFVPHDDENGLEYTPRYANRLAWITNFTGSAGVAIVLGDKAIFVSDGRYKVKAAEEIDAKLIEVNISDYLNRSAAEWLAKHIKAGDKIAYDPQLINPSQLKIYADAVEAVGGEMVACAENLIDLVWERQPARPISPIVPYPLELAGQTWTAKLQAVVEVLRSRKVGAVLITDPPSVAWLFNIRGNDVECTPLPLSYAIVYESGAAAIFCDWRKLTQPLFDHLGGGLFCLPGMESFPHYLEALGSAKTSVLVDPGTANCAVFARLKDSGATIVTGADPCALPKARKNQTELANTRAAHISDGAAICRMLAWFDRESGKGQLTEWSVAQRLIAERLKDPGYRSESFSTIIAAAENGCNPHYFPTANMFRAINDGDGVVMDMGAQLLGGTTDSTRVKVAGGKATDRMRRTYTLVLKGHIAVAIQRFPVGCTGARLDTLARAALWNAGLNFDHGVGHGVGSYLSVHEGPARISFKGGDVPLEEGMILSDEPGEYDQKDHAVRLENLVVVEKATPIYGGTRDMHSFEILTMVPFDRALIDDRLLTKQEIGWLNYYHATVRRAIEPLLEGADRDWLIEATAPIALRGSAK